MVFVENDFGFKIISIMKLIMNTFINFWNVANYTFFTIPLQWLNDLFGLESTDPFYFRDFDFNFVSCITTGLVFILIIHLLSLLYEIVPDIPGG